MKNIQDFYQACYIQTGGWIPMMPIESDIELGDFGQFYESEFRVLGNIYDLNSVDPEHSDEIYLDQDRWQLNCGVSDATKFLSLEAAEEESNAPQRLMVEHRLKFSEQGNFRFSCDSPKAKFITNWSLIEQSLTLALTLFEYNFRDVFVVTSSASSNSWGLGIANERLAELELLGAIDFTGSDEILRSESSIVQNREGVDYQRGSSRPAQFFQAKKLVMSNFKKEEYLRKRLVDKDKYSDRILNNLLRQNPFDLLAQDDLIRVKKSNNDCIYKEHLIKHDGCELDIRPFLEFFAWENFSLDDVFQLC